MEGLKDHDQKSTTVPAEVLPDKQYPHRQPRLNFDILRLVCNCLTDVSDVLSFALTCSTLTKPAFRRRLRMSPVNLWTGELVNSFHNFIFTDEAARAPYIYGLGLPDVDDNYYMEWLESEFQIINGHLVAILQAAIHLEYLHFANTFDFDPALAAAANMTSLRELYLVFEMDSEPPWELLATFQSQLRSLRIDSKGDTADDSLSARLLHKHLANVAPTLQVLELQDLDLDISPTAVMTPFTAVRSLTVHSISAFNEMTAETLLRLFPNLDNTLMLGTSNAIDTAEDLDLNLREWSKEAQKSHTWSRLDRVICDVGWAFLMALRCPIRRMDITGPLLHDKRYLAPTLYHNCPRLLHFRLPFIDRLGDLQGLFPSDGVDNLTHLVMFVDFEIRYGRKERHPIPWHRFRDTLISSMKHLRLTHLRLTFHYTVHQAAHRAERDRVNTAGERDLHSTATRFIDAMPTLRYILLTACGRTFQIPPKDADAWESKRRRTLNRWLSSAAWRPINDYEGRHSSNMRSNASSALLGREAAEKVVEEEELYLSRGEEDVVKECGDCTTWRD